jgi:hypothetical protein
MTALVQVRDKPTQSTTQKYKKILENCQQNNPIFFKKSVIVQWNFVGQHI